MFCGDLCYNLFSLRDYYTGIYIIIGSPHKCCLTFSFVMYIQLNQWHPIIHGKCAADIESEVYGGLTLSLKISY